MNILKQAQYNLLKDHQCKDLADKVNEIVGWINKHSFDDFGFEREFEICSDTDEDRLNKREKREEAKKQIINLMKNL